jgi:peptide-methionine (S)-S-oxide reductase
MSTTADGAASPALAPDADAPAGEGLALAQFAAGCFWSVELVYQRLPGVARTEVGYSQGHRHAPSYRDVCGGGTGHAEVVRVHYDPEACPYAVLLDVFWAKHNPTTLNRQVRTCARVSSSSPATSPADPVAGRPDAPAATCCKVH